MNPFSKDLLAYTDLVENNCRRINTIAEVAHKEISAFDSGQLEELAQLNFGRGLLVLADRYGEANPGLRTFKEWLE